MTETALEVENLSVRYPDSGEDAISGITFTLEKGTITMVIGPNGSGKSTLVKSILGLIPYTGKVSIFGKTGQKGLSHVSYVTQRFEFDRNFPMTVYELISLYMEENSHIFRHTNKNKVTSVLAKLGIEDLIDRPISSLSGGQLQRVLLARALANDPRLLILDEPEAGVDAGAEQSFYDLIDALVEKEKLTVLVASHDLDVIFTYADNVLCINKKLVCNGSPKTALNEETFHKLYGMNIKYYSHKHHHGNT